MSRRAYSEINLHFAWHVKNDEPILRDEIEAQLYRHLRGKAINESGMCFHGVGGTNDHVHLVVSVPPTLSISEWIGRMKGESSHFVNHRIANRKVLAWQSGYGVVSFGTKDLPWVVEYVRNQRQRHAAGEVFERLERVEPMEEEQAR